MRNESESYAYNQISLFSATLSLVVAFLFYISRFGLSDRYTYSLLGFTGLSLVILLSPPIISKAIAGKPGYIRFFLHDTIVPVYLLFFFCLLGSLVEFNRHTIGIVLMLIGTPLYLLSLFYFIRGTRFLTVALSIIMTFIFGIYLASIYWTLLADPLFLENLSQGKVHMDPLFHASIAQMITTHGLPSTGIDLILFLKYHFGSHYLIGKLSAFLNVGAIEFYHFGYLIVFFPLLLRCMLSFIISFQTHFLKLPAFKLSFIFWFLLFAPFIGYISFDANSIALNSGVGYQTIIYSESYAISFIYAFIVFSALLVFNTVQRESSPNLPMELLILLLFFPILISLGGLTKISTLFLVICCCNYLFIRLKLYKKKYYILSVVMINAGGLVMFLLTNDTNDQEGGFYLFQFVNEIIRAPWYMFITVYYFLTTAFCCLIFFGEELYRKQNLKLAFKSFKTLPAETLLVIAIAGFIPGAVLKFYQGNSSYFSEVQYWIAATLILGYCYYFSEKFKLALKPGTRFMLIPVVLVGLYAGYKMQKNWGIYYRRAVDKNLNDRRAITKSFPEWSSNTGRLQLLRAARTGNSHKLDSLVAVLGHATEDALKTSDTYSFLKRLENLDTLSQDEKKKSLIYAQNLQAANFIECHKSPFLLPALTGIAQYKGVPNEKCIGAEGYGYEAYKKVARTNDCFTDPKECDYLKSLGFETFIIIDMEKYTISNQPLR